MALRSTDKRWGSVNRTLHWLMAILIIGAGCVGLYMADLPNSPQKIKIYAIHKSVGLTVLALVLLRFVWRLADRPPPDLPMPRWQQIAAHATHWVLYALMLALPLSGWLYNSASGYPLQWWWTVQLPSLTGGADADIKAFALTAHEGLFWVLVLVLVGHVGAALKHHFVDRDATLVRMLPSIGDPTPPAIAQAEPAPQPAPAAAPVLAEPAPSPAVASDEPVRSAGPSSESLEK
jgi:cytochrome b561